MASVARAKTASIGNDERPQLGVFARMKSRFTNGKGHQNAGHGPLTERKLSSHDFRMIRTLGTGMRPNPPLPFSCGAFPQNPAKSPRR